MESLSAYVDQMNQLLDQLLQTAEKLRAISLRVALQEELEPLQKQQEQILAQLEKIDQAIHQDLGSEVKQSTHQQFQNKLKEFQKLNQEFINNLHSSHGLIQFELQRLKEKEESQL